MIAVCGATGRQGGAVVRSLLLDGWQVRALTRRPDRPPAREIDTLGAEVVRADMDDPGSLREAFAGAHGVFSVQNGLVSGFDREIAQGRNVADAAKAAGIAHLVYASAGPGGPGTGTGVPSWESKLPVEEHVRSLGVPFTILRPTAFMELMTDKKFYPAVGTWRIWPKMTGEDRPIPWLSVRDVGAIAARAFAEPAGFGGKELELAGDVQTLVACRSIFREVMGREPRSFPMPKWLFDRFTRHDTLTMWRWLRTGEVPANPEATRAVLPEALTVRTWLEAVRREQTEADTGKEAR
jgi:uncharacterized protein YbjT (DUF2867 family)